MISAGREQVAGFGRLENGLRQVGDWSARAGCERVITAVIGLKSALCGMSVYSRPGGQRMNMQTGRRSTLPPVQESC